MRFDCGETYSERWERLGKWHRWFAWFPVKVDKHDCRWLEYVERRKECRVYTYDNEYVVEYRPLQG